METFIRLFNELKALIEPVRVFVSQSDGIGLSTSTVTSTASSTAGEGATTTIREVVVIALKVILWGMDLVRELLFKVMGLLS